MTHLQIQKLLAEFPHLEDAGHGASPTPAQAHLLVSSPSRVTSVLQLPHCGLNETMYIKAFDTT